MSSERYALGVWDSNLGFAVGDTGIDGGALRRVITVLGTVTSLHY